MPGLQGLLKFPVVSEAREGPESRTLGLSRLMWVESDLYQSLKNTDATPTAHMAEAWHATGRWHNKSHPARSMTPAAATSQNCTGDSFCLSLSLSLAH